MSSLFEQSFGRSAQRTRSLLIGVGILAVLLIGPVLYFGSREALGLFALPFAGILLVLRPMLGVLAVVGTMPIENLNMVGSVTLTRFLGIAVVGVWFVRKLAFSESWKSIVSTRFFGLTVLLSIFAFLSVLWARYPADVYPALFQLVRLALWSLVIVDLIRSWDHTVWLARTLIVGGLVASVLVIIQYFQIQEQATITGELMGSGRAGNNIAGGLNYTAAVLTTIVPLAFFLINERQQGLWRTLALIYLVLAVGAVVLSQSRLSYAILILVFAVQYQASIRKGGGRGWMVIALLVVMGLAILLAPRELIMNRFGTIVRDFYGERIYHWKVAFTVFMDHPFFGVGYDNYPRLFGEYQPFVSGSYKEWGGLRSAHNTYTAFLAELGLVGFGLWVGILVLGWQHLRRAWSALQAKQADRQARLVRAVSYSYLAQLAFGWGSTIHRDKVIWLLLGLAIALWQLTNEGAHENGD